VNSRALVDKLRLFLNSRTLSNDQKIALCLLQFKPSIGESDLVALGMPYHRAAQAMADLEKRQIVTNAALPVEVSATTVSRR